MFSLVDGQAAACAHKHQMGRRLRVYTIPCPETRLVGSKLKLAPYTALVLDIAYNVAPMSHITISGALPCCVLLCRVAIVPWPCAVCSALQQLYQLRGLQCTHIQFFYQVPIVGLLQEGLWFAPAQAAVSRSPT